MLYQELHSLNDNHLICKQLVDETQVYMITDIGKTTIPLMESMKAFSDSYTKYLEHLSVSSDT